MDVMGIFLWENEMENSVDFSFSGLEISADDGN